MLAPLCHRASSVFDLSAGVRDMSLCQEIKDLSVAPGVGSTPVNWLAEEGLADALSAWSPLVIEPRARPLWKRSLFWVCRLACLASIMVLSITLCLVCPGCHAFFTCFQSCPDSLSRCSLEIPSHVSGPGLCASFH